jgi:hypothetical protein
LFFRHAVSQFLDLVHVPPFPQRDIDGIIHISEDFHECSLNDLFFVVSGEGVAGDRLDGEIDSVEDFGDELALFDEFGLFGHCQPSEVDFLLASHSGVDDLDDGSLLGGSSELELVLEGCEGSVQGSVDESFQADFELVSLYIGQLIFPFGQILPSFPGTENSSNFGFGQDHEYAFEEFFFISFPQLVSVAGFLHHLQAFYHFVLPVVDDPLA